MTYLVAVDSGGTRTNVRIVPPDGEPIELPELDTVIDVIRSRSEMEDNFKSLFGAIQAYLGDSPRSVWISAAGYAASSKGTIERELEKYLSFPGYLGIANDGVSLLLARDEHTVVAIIGTGSVVMARHSENTVVQLGGSGWVANDYGSGFWIGLEGIRAAYRAFEGGPPTSLKNRLVDHYRKLMATPKDTDQLTVPALVHQLAGLGGYDLKRQIASFATVVCDVAQRSDPEAQKVVRLAAKDVADLVARIYRGLAARTKSDDVVVPKVLLCGSVAKLSIFFQNEFRDRLNYNLRGVIADLPIGKVNVDILLSGIDDSEKLAQRLAESKGRGFPELEPLHPVKIYECNIR
jgi:N-acetylglucosamine kinase-like BadF-type ATPase